MGKIQLITKMRGLIVLALALLVSGNAGAENTYRVHGADYTTAADGETQFYLYNVGTGRFIINTGAWGEYAWTLYQDYGFTFTMNSSYQINTDMLAAAQSANAHYLGLNVPKVTSAGQYDDDNAFGPIFEANSSYSNGSGISGTRKWNFVRVEDSSDTNTYTYYMYETLNSTNYYMGVGYGINGDNSDNRKSLNTWEELEDINEGTMTTITPEEMEKPEYYQWRIVTKNELLEILNSQEDESFGGLNVDVSYLIMDGEFTRNMTTPFSTYWKVTNNGSSTEGSGRYEWRYGIDGIKKNYSTYYASGAWNKAFFTLMTPYDSKANGQYSFGAFEGIGQVSQELDMAGLPAGVYSLTFNAIALGSNAPILNVTNGTGVTVPLTTNSDFNKLTAAGNLAIALDLRNHEYSVSFYYSGSGNVTITINKYAATQSEAETRTVSSGWGRSTTYYYYYDTDYVAVDNFRLHYLGTDPFAFDETKTSTDYFTGQDFKNKTVFLKRTFTSGVWNSLVLPVDMTTAQVKECFGSDVQLAKLDNLEGALGNGTINFTSVPLPSEGNAIEAGKFYIIKLTKQPTEYHYSTILDGSYYKIGRRDFNGADVPELVKETTSDGKLVAAGTYIKMEGGCPADSYVFSGGDMYHLQSAKDIKGFRYWINGAVAGENGVKFMVSSAEDATAIDNIVVDAQPATVQGIYTINGTKISDNYVGNLPKGLYIINGKKSFVK